MYAADDSAAYDRTASYSRQAASCSGIMCGSFLVAPTASGRLTFPSQPMPGLSRKCYNPAVNRDARGGQVVCVRHAMQRSVQLAALGVQSERAERLARFV